VWSEVEWSVRTRSKSRVTQRACKHTDLLNGQVAPEEVVSSKQKRQAYSNSEIPLNFDVLMLDSLSN
jgi:hypothetical protein